MLEGFQTWICPIQYKNTSKQDEAFRFLDLVRIIVLGKCPTLFVIGFLLMYLKHHTNNTIAIYPEAISTSQPRSTELTNRKNIFS